MSTRICQQCGGAATYRRPRQQGRRTHGGHQDRKGRDDHDLCDRCWKAALEAAQVVKRERDKARGRRYYYWSL